MVAEIQRFEDAARTAMGDYSQVENPTPVRLPMLGGLASVAGRIFTTLGRPFVKAAA